jgi:hypothetical protein
MALNSLGTNRDQLAMRVDERDRLLERQVLVGDPRRWRPRWFDGRFLAASDLQGEQNYFLIRQADLARAGGSGVIDGLMVSEIPGDASGLDRLRVEPGQGVTDTGELVVPADVPEMQRLDAAFGLQVIPAEPGRTRTGLYLLALRPVEWTANPIGAYPTSLTGTRKVEDSTIVEGVAVTLIPYPEESTEETRQRRRARAAREIFVAGRDRGLTSGVLPLAMVELRGNLVEWVDPFMARRETGAERPAGMDFGFGARALREAHLLQYQRHLADALRDHNNQPFPASTYFDALPPVGQFPARTLDADRLTQRFFPPGIEVELSFVPEDEIPAIVEESLLVPPLDLTVGVKGLTGTGVIVLVPLTRAAFEADRDELPNWDEELPRLRPAFVELKAQASPRELLLSRIFRPAAPVAPTPPETRWRQLLAGAVNNPLLWYVRRRHLPIPANVAGTPVNGDSALVSDPQRLIGMLRTDPELGTAFARLRSIDTPEVNALTRRLMEPRFLDNPALMRTLITRAAGPAEAEPTPSRVVEALAPVADPSTGTGLARVEAVSGTAGRTLRSNRLVESGALPEVDRLAREVPEENLREFTTELRSALREGEDITTNLAELRRRFGRTP